MFNKYKKLIIGIVVTIVLILLSSIIDGFFNSLFIILEFIFTVYLGYGWAKETYDKTDTLEKLEKENRELKNTNGDYYDKIYELSKELYKTELASELKTIKLLYGKKFDIDEMLFLFEEYKYQLQTEENKVTTDSVLTDVCQIESNETSLSKLIEILEKEHNYHVEPRDISALRFNYFPFEDSSRDSLMQAAQEFVDYQKECQAATTRS